MPFSIPSESSNGRNSFALDIHDAVNEAYYACLIASLKENMERRNCYFSRISVPATPLTIHQELSSDLAYARHKYLNPKASPDKLAEWTVDDEMTGYAMKLYDEIISAMRCKGFYVVCYTEIPSINPQQFTNGFAQGKEEPATQTMTGAEIKERAEQFIDTYRQQEKDQFKAEEPVTSFKALWPENESIDNSPVKKPTTTRKVAALLALILTALIAWSFIEALKLPTSNSQVPNLGKTQNPITEVLKEYK